MAKQPNISKTAEQQEQAALEEQSSVSVTQNAPSTEPVAEPWKALGVSEKRYRNGKSFLVKCTWRRSDKECPQEQVMRYCFDESDAITRYCQVKSLYSPDCRFSVTPQS